MTIPVSSIVDVSISVGAKFPARAGFGTANIVTSESGVISLAERIRSYSNLDGVSADWGANTEVLAAATSYFSQIPRPTKLKVSVRFPTNQPGQLRGGSVSTASELSALQSIMDGSFNITIDGATAVAITGLDFSDLESGGDTFVEMASKIQTALRAVASGGFTLATCDYVGGRFLINSGTTGGSSSVIFLTPAGTGTDIGSLLQMKLGEGTITQGVDAETITASLNAIQNIDPDWYGLAFTKEVRDGVQINGEDAVEAAADWVQARIKVFGNTSNDLDVLDSVTVNDIMSVLKLKSLDRVITTFSSFPDQYPSLSVMGRAFTVNFNQPNSTITLNFKQLPGVTVENLTVSQKAVLDSKNGNALVDVGDNYMFTESKMANGRFFDEVHGVDWLQNAIQINIFGYMYTRTTKVPGTDKGAAALEQQLLKALAEAVRNGLAAPGTTSDGEYLPMGYKTNTIPMADINQSDTEARNYPGLSFVVKGAGAIHGVTVNGVFER